VETAYDGITIDKTATTDANGSLSIAAAPKTLAVSSIDFYPRNEGERATYLITIKPQSDVADTSDFIVLFPEEYDYRLGNGTKQCWATGLTGVITCTVNQRELKVNGHNTYKATDTSTITIGVYGIVNPNTDTASYTGQIAVGIRSGKNYSEYNAAAGRFQILQSPGLNNLITTITSNTNSRDTATYSFNTTTQNTIPKVGN
jgi:hypothetical protein